MSISFFILFALLFLINNLYIETKTRAYNKNKLQTTMNIILHIQQKFKTPNNNNNNKIKRINLKINNNKSRIKIKFSKIKINSHKITNNKKIPILTTLTPKA